MKSTIVNTLVLIASLTFVLCSCTNNQPTIPGDLQKSFDKMFPFSNMNTYIQIKLNSNERLKFGSDVNILIENLSDKSIYFSTSTSTIFVRVFMIQENKWVETLNRTTYYSITGGNGYILSPIGSEQPHLFTNSVRPELGQNLKDNNRQQIVRILVIGEQLLNGKKTGIPVAAYLDIFMEP